MQEFDEPAECGGAEELIVGERAGEEELGGVDDGEAAVAFAAECVVREGLEGGLCGQSLVEGV